MQASVFRNKRFFFSLALFLLSVVTLVDSRFNLPEQPPSGSAMRRPSRYKSHPTNYTRARDPTRHIVHRDLSARATGKVNIGYFPNWAIYGTNYQPSNIPVQTLSHIYYAFADVSPSTGNITLTDSNADQQARFAGDSYPAGSNNLYGCLGQMYRIKLANRSIKVILSVGGATYSSHFSFISNAASRANFVASAVQVIEDYGFDGIDIDWEFPASSADGTNFVSLLTALRTALNNLATKKADATPYEISVAVSAGSSNYQYYPASQMNAALTYWNLMAYDYSGSWLSFVDNQANVYGGQRTGVSTDAALKWYLSMGVTASKFVVGIPLYGRSFENTAGLGQSYNGVGNGSSSPGIYSYNTLPLANATVYENVSDISSYSYDAGKKEFVSYDTPNIAILKAQYVTSKGLAGAMYWDLSTDKNGSSSLVSTVANTFGGLDTTPNHINFPNSSWTNIRNNMGNGGVSVSSSSSRSSTSSSSSPSSTSRSSTTTTSSSSSTSTTRSSTTTAPSSSRSSTTTTSSRASSTSVSSSICTGKSAWSSSAVYTGGQQATYNGQLWTAQWWTQGDKPAGTSGNPWKSNGSC